ncbi:hypothetical protein P170DRAFT_474903 [Aspergillus steynii IBT 23096]|uniref:Copper homeostasis protein cutC homolog n=1 Tax=Aspergillus steynii IBT 23096 TaxID=1392250 RepID=A0A2I2GER4_9EURO|nr:uncharacterized protein P170DRAFT_474903 [Aspergillus steynii IBT 23096]PLB51360.1 hypothetical protein P170DRAFT_474903 [Aspergillus steynii IBT 23096]
MIVLEIACFTPQSAVTAAAGGADRIELCHDYAAGGLTPSLDAVATVKSQLSIPVYAMIRPHARSFCYDATDYATMESSMEDLKQAGIDGFVFGILHADSVAIDIKRNQALVARAEGRPCTFHRAFDLIPESDWERAWTDIASCGFTSILTSGGPSGRNATDCLTLLGQRLVPGARRHGLGIIVGGGVRASNVAALSEKTQAPAFHSAALLPSEDEVREDQVRQLRGALDAARRS